MAHANTTCEVCKLEIDAYPDLPSTYYDDIWTGGNVLFSVCKGHVDEAALKAEAEAPVEMAHESTVVFEESGVPTQKEKNAAVHIAVAKI